MSLFCSLIFFWKIVLFPSFVLHSWRNGCFSISMQYRFYAIIHIWAIVSYFVYMYFMNFMKIEYIMKNIDSVGKCYGSKFICIFREYIGAYERPLTSWLHCTNLILGFCSFPLFCPTFLKEWLLLHFHALLVSLLCDHSHLRYCILFCFLFIFSVNSSFGCFRL